jgi:hypothetical protein
MRRADPQSTVSVRVTLCSTPIETAVAGIEYVPAGVEPEPLVGLLELPVPTPELVQLDTPPARIANSAVNSNAFRRRLHPSGSNTSPKASGKMRHPAGPLERADDPDPPVDISTVTFPVTPPLSVSVAGLKRHSAFAGSVPHTNANVPCEPFNGVIVSV